MYEYILFLLENVYCNDFLIFLDLFSCFYIFKVISFFRFLLGIPINQLFIITEFLYTWKVIIFSSLICAYPSFGEIEDDGAIAQGTK
jgi:hypothetical protein